MQKAYKLRDLLDLAERNRPLPKGGSYEDFRHLQDQYKRKFGHTLDTWDIGSDEGLAEFIIKYCLKTGIPVEVRKLPPGAVQ